MNFGLPSNILLKSNVTYYREGNKFEGYAIIIIVSNVKHLLLWRRCYEINTSWGTLGCHAT